MGSDYLCKVNKKRNLDYFLGKYYSILLYQLVLGYYYRYDKCLLVINFIIVLNLQFNVFVLKLNIKLINNISD